MAVKDYWSQRFREAGEYGTVSLRSATPHEYWQQAMRIWKVCEPLVPGNIDRAVDIGCGGGRFVPYLMSRARRLVGCDICPEMVDAFNRRWHDKHVVGRLCGDLPLPIEAPVDFAWSATVLQHCDVETVELYIRHLAKVASKSGLTVVIYEAMGEIEADHDMMNFRPVSWYKEAFRAEGFTYCELRPDILDPPHMAMRFTR